MTNSIANTYSKLPNLVFGFHGCKQETFENVLYKHQPLEQSMNRYDWLGHGIYFWENSYQRALEWASRYEHPAVIGAIIDLGHCLNLTDYYSTQVLQAGYQQLIVVFLQKENLLFQAPVLRKKLTCNYAL